MDMQLLPYNNHGSLVETSWLEELLFKIGDLCDIRVVLDPAVVTSAAAILGGLLGALAGGRTGAVLGASLAGAVGYGASTELNLRDAWEKIKDKLYGLLNIIIDFLRKLDYYDYMTAVEILLSSNRSREELCLIIIQYIAVKAGAKAYRVKE